MAIPILDNPPFVVNLQQFALKTREPAPLSLNERVTNAAYSGLEFVKIVFVSFGKAGYLTLSYSWISFKHIALGYYGSLWRFRPPATIYLVVLRIAFWALSLGYNCIRTTFRLVSEKYSNGDIDYLKTFIGNELNSSHITTEDLDLDVSVIPEDKREFIKVDLLAEFYNEIDYEDKNSIYYFSPNTRKEGSKVYTIKDLNESMTLFINSVKTRRAFLGTPPQTDTPALMAYYQQIEDALRLTIYKLSSDIEEFESEHDLIGKTPAQKNEQAKALSAEDLKKYKDLLEDRARLATDIAIAGKHCGGRYMGESMTSYFNYCGEGSTNGEEARTLKESLENILALKRREIALAEIEKYLGNNTHGFPNYMQNFGKMLAIPGSGKVTEQLGSHLDKGKLLRSFFNKYTTNYVIDAVQDKVKSSQVFREKITNWLKDQPVNWKKEEYMKLADPIIASINRVKLEELQIKEIDLQKNFKVLKELLGHLKSKEVVLPNLDKGLEEFFKEVFVLDQSKVFLKNIENLLEKFPHYIPKKVPSRLHSQIVCSKIKAQIIYEFPSDDRIKFALESYLKSENYDNSNEIDTITSKIAKTQPKINKIQSILSDNELSLGEEGDTTILGILEGSADTDSVVKQALDRNRQAEFITALRLGGYDEVTYEEIEGIDKKGLSKKLLEWILVSQGILLPQEVI